jgi:hypothetical protein
MQQDVFFAIYLTNKHTLHLCCLQVGLASCNDAVVCACVRVLAALLQAQLGLQCSTQPDSKQRVAAHSWRRLQEHPRDNSKEAGQQQQQQQQQEQDAQPLHVPGTESQQLQQQLPHHLVSNTVDQPQSNIIGDELQLPSKSSSKVSWQELLQLLLRTAAATGSSATVRAAALQEMRLLLLHLADALSAADPAAPAGAGEAQGNQLAGSTSSRCCRLAAVRQALLPEVLQLALMALQEEQQEVRR